ncbi:hypothetical protein INE81_01354 [Bacteroides salyersiae]|uniref:hypothetical protein n=1 Tax=Bacteroides salyersiae TaxID=291644 RepID=UPI001B8B8B1A|nr:hypothetical protein [Bacteroides salyersiae]QUT74911.1 hypothetical protein INE81_01354 [Bacteroides salyersiae]
MGINELVIDVTVDTVLDIEIGDYVKVDNIEYTLNRDVEFELKSEVECAYSIVFEHPIYKLLDKLYQDKITQKTSFTLTGRLIDFVELIVWCMNKTEDNPLGVDTGWSVGYVLETNYRTISFNSAYCRDVLTTLANEYGVEYYLNNKEINYVSHIENETGLVFTQGAGEGLYTITQKNVDKENAITRIYPLGGTNNVPNKYANLDGRLVLPEIYLENLSEYSRIVEKCVVFENIEPSFIGQVTSVSGDYNRVVRCPEIDFNIDEVAVGDDARINFLSGDLMGKSFEFKWDNEKKEITLIRQEDDIALPDEEGNRPLIPNDSKKAKLKDEFNFTGLIMPEEYVLVALEDLRKTANEWLGYYSRRRLKFELNVNYRYLRGRRELKPGDLITVKILSHGIDKLIRITQVEKNLHTGKLTCTVSNYLDEKWEKKIEGQIGSIQQQITGGYLGGKTVDIIEKNDIRTPKDSNVFSSLRTWKEISERALSRLVPDTASELITFIKGLVSESMISAQDGVQFGKSFASGLTGHGGLIDSFGRGELESLVLRRFLETPELRYNRIRVTAGDLWLSPGGGLIESVEPDMDMEGNLLDTGTVTLKLESGEIGTIAVDDLCMGMYHYESGNATEDYDDGIGNRRMSGFSTCYFRITEILETATNSKFRYKLRDSSDNYPNPIAPASMMHFVSYGNASNELRQSSIYLKGSGNPYIRILKEVNWWEFSFKNIGCQFGYLDNLKIFGVDTTGYSAFINSLYFYGKIEQLEKIVEDTLGTGDLRMEIKNSEDAYVFVDNNIDVILTAKVFKYFKDITSEVVKWVWTRESGTSLADIASDAIWNDKNSSARESVHITAGDITTDSVKFICEATIGNITIRKEETFK